ncbi:hypothetical protein [Microcystis aeruginosa]|uniref:Uncharacterized protein n=1 Tax=Microcystis aeruginosa FD4 TaxID=2686288 RepID=A0A857D7K5_MICAE|nr:hypothetical protein [Microcystis aeruginosa]QGZ91573.1 hypothetical protein GQR42_20710 [Microcystis aeruginosa FD4]
MKIGKTLHPTPHTPHPTPTRNFFSIPYLNYSLRLQGSAREGRAGAGRWGSGEVGSFLL